MFARYLNEIGASVPDENLNWGFKVVGDDRKAFYCHTWPSVGTWVTVPEELIFHHNTAASPRRPGDGMCVANTWASAATYKQPLDRLLVIGYRPDDVLGASAEQSVRVRAAYVAADVDLRSSATTPRSLYESLRDAPEPVDPNAPLSEDEKFAATTLEQMAEKEMRACDAFRAFPALRFALMSDPLATIDNLAQFSNPVDVALALPHTFAWMVPSGKLDLERLAVDASAGVLHSDGEWVAALRCATNDDIERHRSVVLDAVANMAVTWRLVLIRDTPPNQARFFTLVKDALGTT